jgi:hypothetical protein
VLSTSMGGPVFAGKVLYRSSQKDDLKDGSEDPRGEVHSIGRRFRIDD